jgi:hypothetical protein
MNLPEQILKHFLEQGLFKDQLTGRLTVICWVMLVAAAMIWIFLGRSKRGYEYTAVYWLACGVGVWLCLYLPLEWIIPTAILAIGVLSFLFAFLPVWRSLRAKAGAWPHHLPILLVPYKLHGGILTSITALALVVFFLGLCYITSPNAARGCFIMGASLLLLVQYDFRSESALAGMVLVTLAVVSAFLDLFHGAGQSPTTILNMVIIPLAYMSFHWIWLGTVWQKQIIDGRPLTTSAKMVHLTRHMGTMLLGFSTLLAIKLALWPMMPAASGADDSPSRYLLMTLAFAILLVSNFWIAFKMRLVSLAALAALNIFGTAMAFITRNPGFFHRIFWPHWHLFVAGYLFAVLVAVLVLRKKYSQPSIG